MNKKLIYSEIVAHVLFWLMVVVVQIWFYMHFQKSFNRPAFIEFLIGLGPFIILVNINIIFFIPKLLKKGKYLYYVLAFLALWVIGGPIDIYFHNQLLYLLSDDADLRSTNLFDFSQYVAMLGFMVATSFITLVFRLIQQQDQYSTLKILQTSTELDLLKNQINPHFFFNTLHNLNGLVLENSNKASKVIVKLSKMMRYTIYDCKAKSVSLNREIEYLNNYLYLQKIRLHNPIDMQLEVVNISPETTVPPLLFIIFIENAFKHGVDSLTGEGFVHILIKEEKDHIYFGVKNNYDLSEKMETHGLGIENAKKRLNLLFGGKSTLKILDDQKIFEIQLSLPRI